MSTGLPSMISCRQPFFRASVRTKSSSSPYTLNSGARSSISSAHRERKDGLQDLARRSAGCRLAGARAARLADGREEQVQIAREIGHRAHSRARVAADRFLFDGDDWRQAEDEIHVWLGDLGDEPLRVARQRFHVPALPLGVKRVERQARLARAGEPCDNDQLVARDLDRDVLEVVHTRSLHGDGCARCGPG